MFTERQCDRLDRTHSQDEALEFWLYVQHLPSAYKGKSPVKGRPIAETVLASLPTCPIPEIKRLNKTPKQWWQAFLANFHTDRANNVGTGELLKKKTSPHRKERGPTSFANSCVSGVKSSPDPCDQQSARTHTGLFTSLEV